jgi:TetR/AcrR family transcriptional repressor of nem operon
MARPRTFDEADVVDAARDEFWSRGYTATSVDDLSAATGLGKGSLYGAFRDKHALYLRVLEDYWNNQFDEIRADLHADGLSAYERLARHILAMAASIAADRGRRGCMMAKGAAELAARDHEVADSVDRMMGQWRAELVDTIKAAQAEGSVDPNRNPRTLATLILALVRGLEALNQSGAKPTQIRAAANEALALIGA